MEKKEELKTDWQLLSEITLILVAILSASILYICAQKIKIVKMKEIKLFRKIEENNY